MNDQIITSINRDIFHNCFHTVQCSTNNINFMQQTVTAENFEMVGTAVVSIVSELDEADEQSTDNLDIIASVYENITQLVQEGLMVTENVRAIIV